MTNTTLLYIIARNINFTSNIKYICIFRFSFGEISGNTISGDVLFLIAGNAILFIYVTMMLGRFNLVEQRVRNKIR